MRNYNFHFSIYASSQNEDLLWSIERPWTLTGPYLAQVLHSEIARAIKSRNVAEAARLIDKDISWGVTTFAAFVEEGIRS